MILVHLNRRKGHSYTNVGSCLNNSSSQSLYFLPRNNNLIRPLKSLICDPVSMASEGRGRPLPKFGEWDVNDPASAEGFTVIFNKARDEKKTNTTAGSTVTTGKSGSEPVNDNKSDPSYSRKFKKKWLCCC